MSDVLRDILRGCGRLAVAVSGGVDSLTLAALAHATIGEGAVMHHAQSPAVPAEATARTRALAHARGWRLEVFDAGEFADPQYRANPANRCLFCKTNLYGAIARRTDAQVISGTNLDDLGEYRPGLEAARAHGVRHPFVEAGIDKAGVRALAAALGLGAVAELPASPCLSSRIETGIRIEPALLGIVERSEQMLRAELAPRTIRCRVRAGGIVVELDQETLHRLDGAALAALRGRLAATLDGTAREMPISFAPYRNGSAFLRPPA
jgi:uncharacterized protein